MIQFSTLYDLLAFHFIFYFNVINNFPNIISNLNTRRRSARVPLNWIDQYDMRSDSCIEYQQFSTLISTFICLQEKKLVTIKQLFSIGAPTKAMENVNTTHSQN